MAANATSQIAALFKSGALLFGSSLLNRTLAFGAHLLMVRVLEPESFGTLALVYTLGTVIGTLTLAGLPEGGPRLIAGAATERKQNRIAGTTIAIGLGLSFLFGVFLIFFGDLLADLLSLSVLDQFGPYLAFYICCYVLAKILIGILRGHEQSVATAYIRDLIPYIIGLSGLAVGLQYFTARDAILGYWIGVQVFVSVLALCQLIRIGSPLGLPSTATFWEVTRFSWPLALSAGFALFMSGLDIILLGILSTQRSVGLYKGVQPLASLILLGLSSIVFLYLPVATNHYEQGEYDALDGLFRTSTKWIAILTFPLAAVFVAFSPGVINGLLGEEYISAAAVLAVLSLTIYSRVFVGPNAATAKAIGRPEIDLWSTALGAAVNLVANLALIPRFGALGAAISTLIGYLIYNFLEIGLIYAATQIHPFTVNTLKPLVVTTVIVGGVRFWIGGSPPFWLLITFGIGLLAIQIPIAVLVGGLDEKDRELLTNVSDHIRANLIAGQADSPTDG